MHARLTVTALALLLAGPLPTSPIAVNAQAGTTAPSAAEAVVFVRVYREGTPGLTPPVLRAPVRLAHTPEAMRARVQGTVELEITVGADGHVRDALVLKSLDAVAGAYGMDDQALAAAAGAIYRPGQLAGKAVPVRIALKLSAILH